MEKDKEKQMEDKNKLVKQYLDSIYEYFISIGYPLELETREKFLNKYIGSDMSYEEIKSEIDRLVLEKLRQIKKMQEIMSRLQLLSTEIPEDEKKFGESLNYQMIGLFENVEELEELALEDIGKRQRFMQFKEQWLKQSGYIGNGLADIDYDTVRNLYNNFINDIDIVVDEWATKMARTINPNVPLFNEDGTLNNEAINLSLAEYAFDFAIRHQKEIKLHTLVWHYEKSFPQSLELALQGKNNSEREQITMRFLDEYMQYLAIWSLNKNYSFSQIDVLNEIANDKDDTAGIFRDSAWTRAFGIDPLPKFDNTMSPEEYQMLVDNHTKKCAEAYAKVFKLAKRYFPNSELLYNDYDEFLPYKCDRISKIIDEFHKIEARDGVKLIDGFGMQSHFSDYYKLADGTIKQLTAEDIYYSMEKLAKLGINLHRTEKDFVCSDINFKNQLESVIESTDSAYGVKSVISWNNNDSTSWRQEKDYNLDVHMVDRNGVGKREYEHYAGIYSKKRKEKERKKENHKTLTLTKKESLDNKNNSGGFVSMLSVSLIMILLVGFSIFIGYILYKM